MNVNGRGYDLVIGLGETGRPLLGILQQKYRARGRDVDPVQLQGRTRVLHICFTYANLTFLDTVAAYVGEYKPELTIIHSTVVPGTSRALFYKTRSPVAYSPIRGKHTHMREDLLRYTKFVAGVDTASSEAAARYLAGAGFEVSQASSCEVLELAKLVETTYFGVLVGWAQEVERYCARLHVDYDEAMGLTGEVDYLPPVLFRPGYIGGHCVIPNTYLLEETCPSALIEFIRNSNELKKEQWLKEGRDLNERIAPVRVRVEP